MNNCIKWILALVSTLNATTATAADFSLLGAEVSLSGFGTAGFAISDKPYNFERVISNDGTMERDSLVGAQADLKFTAEISATVQGKFAPSKDKESAWEASLIWACLSWRPYNDLLFRIGKQRVPIYLYSESMDVGVTYDFARLPTEMYSTAPNTDYIGGSFSKSWDIDLGELTLDGFLGESTSSWRDYQRDNIQIPSYPLKPGANYLPFTADTIGSVLTLQRDENRFRASFQYVDINMDDGVTFGTSETLMPASFFVPATLAPALIGSAYTVLPQNFGNKLTSLVITLGTEIKLPEDFRLIGEYSRRQINGYVTGIDTNGGYFAVLKDIDGWTPYVSFAMLKTKSDVLDLYQMINSNAGVSVNPLAPPIFQSIAKDAAVLANASQRVVADALAAFDQHTIAVGTSYSFTPTQKIKLEWARTHIGVTSNFVDAPSGSSVSNEDIDVFSFSYNVVF
ncbi:MAG: hypothetical protein Q8N96_12785 [Methylovulum sp.]|nr:hypothetical protein [Methylovulum sp.]